MQIFNAIRLTIETCERKHLSFSSQQTYTHWIKRYGLFLKDRTLASQTTEQKMEAFLTMLAGTGISASTQNQAFSALLFFYREVLHQQLGAVDALRALAIIAVALGFTGLSLVHLYDTSRFTTCGARGDRSEERRVGKECRSR